MFSIETLFTKWYSTEEQFLQRNLNSSQFSKIVLVNSNNYFKKFQTCGNKYIYIIS